MTDFDINDIIIQDEYESNQEFLARKKLTLKLASINDDEMNPMTAVVTARLILNKVKLGVTYEPHVEKLLEKLQPYLLKK